MGASPLQTNSFFVALICYYLPPTVQLAFLVLFQLIDFMNLFYETFDNRISKFKVYNVHTMGEEFMVVSGMPNRIGENVALVMF